MKKPKNLIVILIVAIIILIATLTILVLKGKIKFNNNSKNKEPVEIWSNIKEEYNYGDSIIINKLSQVKSIDDEERENDLSNWHVLENEKDYILIVSDMAIFKSTTKAINEKLENIKIAFLKKGLDFGNEGQLRLINETDANKYFDCNQKNQIVKQVYGLGQEKIFHTLKL